MHYQHLDFKARDRIEALLRSGHRQAAIARILKVSPSTVSREIKKRGLRSGRYDATRAEEKATVRRSNSKYQGMKVEAHPEVKALIINELKALRSPDEIAGRMRVLGMTPRVGAAAIYRWLYSSFGQQYCQYLCTRRWKPKRHRGAPKRETIPNRIPLVFRPYEGVHAEGDTFGSGRKSLVSGVLTVLIESKLMQGSLIPNREAKTVLSAVRVCGIGRYADTLTLDNGTENVLHEFFGLLTFFCDPHAPWQKPHVENSIGLIRRWFLPKRTDLSTVPNSLFQAQLTVLNHKWRKSLGYRSAYEVALETGIIKKAPSRALAVVALEARI